tara:strand:- start:224 stop:1195 length:972 start_codon:yes stop_codon:yes gene_type:complete
MRGAIIGLGHGQRVIAKAFEIEKIKLIGVYSKNVKKAHIYSKENNLNKLYNSLDDLINDKEIDLVAIAIPAYYQVEIIKKCIKHNKKIFCEKPMTINYDKLKKIYSSIKKFNNKLIVDYIFQKHEAFIKFKNNLPKTIHKNSKIKINFTTESFINKNKINNWKNKPYLGGGIINLYLPHILEYLIFFFGNISKCKVIRKDKDFLIVNYFFHNEIFATININSNNPKKEHSIVYEDNKIKLVLKNISKDYAKGFKLTKLNKLNKTKKIIPYNNAVNKFTGDGRIFLTSKLLKLFSKKFKMKEHIQKINEYFYIESTLNETRKNL